MEKWEQPRPHAPPSHLRGRNSPSFSSSLLDAIYRSIDDSDAKNPNLPFSSTQKKLIPVVADKIWSHPPPPPGTLRSTRDPADDRRHRRFFSATSSSDCSSFGGFSSSDAESTARPRPVLIRTEPPPPPEKKRSGGSIRSRIRDLRKSPAPASPGSRLAAFLNAIFAPYAIGSPKKPKFAGCVEEPVSSSASSISRSGTRKSATSSRGRGKHESVQFSAVSVVVSEDRRQAKPSGGGDPTVARDRRRMVGLLKGFEKMEDEEDCESVSSSDLFELDSLSVIGRFADELPVYETTNMVNSHAIARGFIV